MAKCNRHGNPVYNAHDKLIREMLANEQTSDDERDAVLAEQVRLLREAKTRADPDWQQVQQPAVEIQVVRDVVAFDGMVRKNRRA